MEETHPAGGNMNARAAERFAAVADSPRFHQLYGLRKPRMSLHRTDLADYVLMSAATAGVLLLCYGPDSLMAWVGVGLCALMVGMFPLRHGWALRIPLLLRRPQDLLYLLLYKIRNIKSPYFLALALLAAQSYLIHLTPRLPHHTDRMRVVALYLFYGHFLGILAYRSVILVAHLKHRRVVGEFLRETSWRAVMERQPSTVLQIVHAYVTGVLTHMVLLAPWYVVIRSAGFSVLFLPVLVVLNALIYFRYLKAHNGWFYRDHWLGHNVELEFIYLHGTHHDAIPCGLIGVAGNGHLEGFIRHVAGFPTQFFDPLTAFAFFSMMVVQDIAAHQYIPGIFPKLPRGFHEVAQHSTHHMGSLEPYSFGLKFNQPHVPEQYKKPNALLPGELKDSIELDERLTGFRWDNRHYRKYLVLFDRYQGAEGKAP